MSSDANDPKDFGAELKRRFEELAAWAVAHAPANKPLSNAAFDNCRREIARLATPATASMSECNAALPEPSEAGPQYVDTNPTPWP